MPIFPSRRSGEERGEQYGSPPPPPGPPPALFPPAAPGTGRPGGPDAGHGSSGHGSSGHGSSGHGSSGHGNSGHGDSVYDVDRDGGWPPGAPTSRAGLPGAGPQYAPAPPPAPAGDLDGPWQPILIDGAAPGFTYRPPAGGLSYRPDTVCDGWSTDALDLRLASVRGYAHRAEGRPREDDAAAAYDEISKAVVFAVADGVSDARQPHIGSQLACRSAVGELLDQVRANGGHVTDWGKLLGTVHWQLREQAARLLRRQDATVEETADLLATTLVAGAATPTPEGVQVALVSVGDSGVWAIKHGQLYGLSGGKELGSDGLVSSAVQPLPYVPADIRPRAVHLDPGMVLLVGTDGFGDPVGDGRGRVADLFTNELTTPIPPLAFAFTLDFYRETFDDDRTLLALWPRGGPR
ncbi:protein phosphatase 2C domain-containing protein [Streptomyces sp. NPDC059467]|uniref:protein phosphatase 2C domain-containing protein n=1 Tax=Streptomyces sp. NPDC059467 TaxID=3346844 RepID=UPI003695FF0D